MSVCCECCVLSGRGICNWLITRPEESYRLLCVVLCDLETSWMRKPWPTGGLLRQKERKVHLFLTLALDGGEWLVPFPGSFTISKGLPIPTEQGTDGGPKDSLDALGKTRAFACARKRTQSSRPAIPYPLRDFRLPPWSGWELCSSGLLRSV